MAALTAVLLIMALCSLPFAVEPATPQPAFLPGYYSLVILTDCITAYLLLSQFFVVRRPPLCILAGGYLYAGLMSAAQFVSFPGIFGDTGLIASGPQTSAWLWIIWHAGFPLFIIAYAIAQHYYRAGEGLVRYRWAWQVATVSGVVALVGTIVYCLAHYEAALPKLIDGNNYNVVRSSGLGLAVWLSDALALVGLIWFTRGKVVSDLWLILAVLAALFEVTLSVTGGSRFTVGWYMARVFSVISASVILAVFMDEITRLYMRVSELNGKLQRLVSLDGLTGLANRRYFDQRLAAEWSRSRREKLPFSLIMLDIDHFKKLNDRDGHLVGDECIKMVANVIAICANRGVDVCARYGGEEYAVILPGTHADGAMLVAQRILGGVRELEIPAAEEVRFVTVSIGVVTALPTAKVEAVALLKAADEALYASKAKGRNRVTVAETIGADGAPGGPSAEPAPGKPAIDNAAGLPA